VETPSNYSLALDDGIRFTSLCAQALAQDEFSKCFQPKPVRPPKGSVRWCLWACGVFVRYFILLPFRLSLLIVASFAFFSVLPMVLLVGSQGMLRFLFLLYCKCWLCSFSASVKYHGKKPDLRGQPHIFVANHTSFVDYFLLSAHDFPHASVAQTHSKAQPIS
jgi:glycerol-3-phosphate O-acyltransferase 3/4